MTSPKGLMAIAAAGAAALLAAGAAHPANEPETVATIPALVHALTEDGGRIAWIDIAWRLRVRGLRGGPVHSIRFTTNREEADDLFWEPRLILHGGTLFWRSFKVSHSGYERDRLTADVESRTWRQLGWTYGSEGYVGQHIAGIAADGDHVVYGLDVVRADEQTLDVSLVGGAIFTATASGARRKLPGAPPSKVLAAGGGLIAAAPIESEGRTRPSIRATPWRRSATA